MLSIYTFKSFFQKHLKITTSESSCPAYKMHNEGANKDGHFTYFICMYEKCVKCSFTQINVKMKNFKGMKKICKP